MYQIRLILISIVICFIILFSCCAKKIISNETKGLVKPAMKTTMKLQIAYFVNQSNKDELDRLEEAIPRFLLEDMMLIKKIHLPSKYPVITNKKEIIQAKKYFDSLKSEEVKEVFDDVQDDSETVLGKPISIQKTEKKKNKANSLKKNQTSLFDKTNELNLLLDYIKFYESEHPEFKKFLGIDVNRSLFKTIGVYDLQVDSSFIRLETKKVFQLNHIYQQLAKSSADLTLIGTIQDSANKITIHVKLYNKYLHQFIFSKSFSFSKKNLSIHFTKRARKVSNKLVSLLTDFPKGKLIITTKPNGAYVFLDGKSIGHSNLKKKIIYGYHTVEILKKGYQKISGEIYVEKNKLQKLIIKLDKLKGRGTISISSNPEGADIYIDLDFKGKTPAKIKKLKPGIYKIRLEKKGYRYSYLIVHVKPNKEINVSFKMRKGETKYQNVAELSTTYNTFKNIFFYSSLVSITAMLYAYLKVDKFHDKYVGETVSATKKAEYLAKYNQAKTLKNVTIGTTIGLVALTAVFQLLELYSEDIEVGFTPKGSDKKGSKTEDEVGANLRIKIRF